MASTKRSAATPVAARKPVPNRKQEVELYLGDGTYLFRPGIGGAEAIQETCDAGPPEVLERLSSNRWRINDVVAPIRYGLEGGGTPAGRVVFLIDRYVTGRPLAESVPIAQAIMLALIMGIEDEPLKKDQGAKAAKNSPGKKSPSESSTSKGPD